MSVEATGPRCKQCGVGRVLPTVRQGRTTTWNGTTGVPVPDDLAVPTCTHCGAEWFDEATARRFDEAMQQSGYTVYGDDVPSNTAGAVNTPPATIPAKEDPMSQYTKQVNNTAAMATRGRDSNNGPARLLTVPDHTTKQQMEEMLDTWMALPRHVVGHVLIVKEGVAASPLSRGHGAFVFTAPEHYEEQELEQLVDVALALPEGVIDNVVVVREGVSVTPL